MLITGKTNISVSDVETLDLAVPYIYLNGKAKGKVI